MNGVLSQYAAWRPVSSSTGLYALRLDSPEWPIAQQGHSRFWC